MNPARAALHPIQPLAIPRRIAYREIHKTVELEPASGGPFEDYDKLVRRLAPAGTSYLAVHQQTKLREALHAIASRVPWTAVADRQVDRDLRIGELRIMTARDGERDVAGFARSTVPFRRPLRDVVREYNAYISNEDLDDLLEQLSDLLDAGILNLRPDASGKTNFNRIKGLLGTLIAARWFRKSGDDATRLLVSLDGAEARRWLHLSDDPLRADLVGFTWTNDHCTVSVIEVKAVQAKGTEYAVEGGVVSGAAIDQMLSTRRLLEQVFAANRDDELITTPARREILREHLYRELTKGTYTADERKLWADRLQRLLDGAVTTDLRCHLIDVRLGVDSDSLNDMNVVAHEGENSVPVEITELNERQIEVLIPTEPPEPEPEADEGGEPEPPADEDAAGTAEEPDEPPPAPSDAAAETPEPEADDEPPAPEPGRAGAAAHPTGRARCSGTSPGEYGKPREIWFDPQAPEDRLPNPHMMITGETGSGKTQATKAILADMRPFDVPALILDFKDDYSEPVYAETEGFNVYDPSDQSLPFNPLAPAVDPRSGRVNPTHHLHQLTDIIKRIYRLGDQQAYRLREAMKTVYENAGVPTRAFVPDADQAYPAFEAVQHELARGQGQPGAARPDVADLRPGAVQLGRAGDRLRQRRRAEHRHPARAAPRRRGQELGRRVLPDGALQLPDPPAAGAPARPARGPRRGVAAGRVAVPRTADARGPGVRARRRDRVAVPDRPADAGRRLDGDQALLLADQRRADPRHPAHDPRQDIGRRRRPPRRHHARAAAADLRAVQQAVPALRPGHDQPVLRALYLIHRSRPQRFPHRRGHPSVAPPTTRDAPATAREPQRGRPSRYAATVSATGRAHGVPRSGSRRFHEDRPRLVGRTGQRVRPRGSREVVETQAQYDSAADSAGLPHSPRDPVDEAMKQASISRGDLGVRERPSARCVTRSSPGGGPL